MGDRAADPAKTGDKYRDRGIVIEVGEVDPDGQWAMIHCTVNNWRGTGNKREWDKQQPLVDGRFPGSWYKVPDA